MGFIIGFTETGGIVQKLMLHRDIATALSFLPSSESPECFLVIQKNDEESGRVIQQGINVAKRIPAVSHAVAMRMVNLPALREYPRLSELRLLADTYVQMLAGMMDKEFYRCDKVEKITNLGKWLNPEGNAFLSEEQKFVSELAGGISNCLDPSFERIRYGIQFYLRLISNEEEMIDDFNSMFISKIKDLLLPHVNWFDE